MMNRMDVTLQRNDHFRVEKHDDALRIVLQESQDHHITFEMQLWQAIQMASKINSLILPDQLLPTIAAPSTDWTQEFVEVIEDE